MGKRRPRWDEAHYHQYLKEGRGQGTGADYRPWVNIHGFPSHGVSARVLGRTTGRIHEFLSRNEEYYFYLLDTDPDVLDIREQFPLRLTETLDIALRMGIDHPRINGFPFVLTTDFLITRSDGLHARTVKMSNQLDDPRIIEKFSIECKYWENHQIDWKIVTEKEIDRTRARNLRWLYYQESAEKMITDPVLHREARLLFMKLLGEGEFPVADIVEIIETGLNLRPGSGVTVYKELIRDGLVQVDMNRRIDRDLQVYR